MVMTIQNRNLYFSGFSGIQAISLSSDEMNTSGIA